jgi:hypothetical protein
MHSRQAFPPDEMPGDEAARLFGTRERVPKLSQLNLIDRSDG